MCYGVPVFSRFSFQLTVLSDCVLCVERQMASCSHYKTLSCLLLCFWTILKLYLFILNAFLAVEAVISVVVLLEIQLYYVTTIGLYWPMSFQSEHYAVFAQQ